MEPHLVLIMLLVLVLLVHQAMPTPELATGDLLVVVQRQVCQQGTHSEGNDGVLADGARQRVHQGRQQVHTCSVQRHLGFNALHGHKHTAS